MHRNDPMVGSSASGAHESVDEFDALIAAAPAGTFAATPVDAAQELGVRAEALKPKWLKTTKETMTPSQEQKSFEEKGLRRIGRGTRAERKPLDFSGQTRAQKIVALRDEIGERIVLPPNQVLNEVVPPFIIPDEPAGPDWWDAKITIVGDIYTSVRAYPFLLTEVDDKLDKGEDAYEAFFNTTFCTQLRVHVRRLQAMYGGNVNPQIYRAPRVFKTAWGAIMVTRGWNNAQKEPQDILLYAQKLFEEMRNQALLRISKRESEKHDFERVRNQTFGKLMHQPSTVEAVEAAKKLPPVQRDKALTDIKATVGKAAAKKAQALVLHDVKTGVKIERQEVVSNRRAEKMQIAATGGAEYESDEDIVIGKKPVVAKRVANRAALVKRQPRAKAKELTDEEWDLDLAGVAKTALAIAAPEVAAGLSVAEQVVDTLATGAEDGGVLHTMLRLAQTVYPDITSQEILLARLHGQVWDTLGDWMKSAKDWCTTFVKETLVDAAKSFAQDIWESIVSDPDKWIMRVANAAFLVYGIVTKDRSCIVQAAAMATLLWVGLSGIQEAWTRFEEWKKPSTRVISVGSHEHVFYDCAATTSLERLKSSARKTECMVRVGKVPKREPQVDGTPTILYGTVDFLLFMGLVPDKTQQVDEYVWCSTHQLYNDTLVDVNEQSGVDVSSVGGYIYTLLGGSPTDDAMVRITKSTKVLSLLGGATALAARIVPWIQECVRYTCVETVSVDPFDRSNTVRLAIARDCLANMRKDKGQVAATTLHYATRCMMLLAQPQLLPTSVVADLARQWVIYGPIYHNAKMQMDNQTDRITPVCVFFYGTGGEGKTVAAQNLADHIVACVKKRTPIPTDIYVRGTGTEHYDDYPESCLVFRHEEMFSSKDKEVNAREAREFKQAISSAKYAMAGAAIAEKNKPFNAKYYLATSNAVELSFEELSERSFAPVARRMHMIVMVLTQGDFAEQKFLVWSSLIWDKSKRAKFGTDTPQTIGQRIGVAADRDYGKKVTDAKVPWGLNDALRDKFQCAEMTGLQLTLAAITVHAYFVEEFLALTPPAPVLKQAVLALQGKLPPLPTDETVAVEVERLVREGYQAVHFDFSKQEDAGAEPSLHGQGDVQILMDLERIVEAEHIDVPTLTQAVEKIVHWRRPLYFVLTCAGLYGIFKLFTYLTAPTEPQEVVEQSVKINTVQPRRTFRRVNEMHAQTGGTIVTEKVIEVDPQSYTNAESVMIADARARCDVRIVFSDNTETTNLHTVFVGPRAMLINRHAFPEGLKVVGFKLSPPGGGNVDDHVWQGVPYEDEENDMVWVQLDEHMPQRSSIRKRLKSLQGADLVNKQVIMCHYDPTTNVFVNTAAVVVSGDSRTWKTSRGVVTPQDMFVYRALTHRGDCGTVIYYECDGTAYAVGYHIAGDAMSSAVALTLSSDYVSAFEACVVESGATARLSLEAQAPDLVRSPAFPMDVEPVDGQFYGNTVVARVKGGKAAMKLETKYVEAPFYGAFGKLPYQPAELGPMKNGDDPLEFNMKKFNQRRREYRVVPDKERVFARLQALYPKNDKFARTLTDDEAALGCQELGVKPINVHTSVGPPFKFSGRSDKTGDLELDVLNKTVWMSKRMRDAVHYREEKAKQGQRVLAVWSASWKDELRPAAYPGWWLSDEELAERLRRKDAELLQWLEEADMTAEEFATHLQSTDHKWRKVRLFFSGPLDLLILSRKYTAGISGYMQSLVPDAPGACGVAPNSVQWAIKYKQMAATQCGDPEPHVLSADFKDFDKSRWAAANNLAIEFVNWWYGDTDKVARTTIMMESVSPYLLVKEYIVSLSGSSASGSDATTWMNTLVNIIVLSSAICVVEEISPRWEGYMEKVMMWIYGDDNNSAAPNIKEFPWRLLVEILAGFGMHITPASKIGELTTVALSESTFLGRGFRWHKGWCYAPLKLDRILVSIYYQRHQDRDAYQNTLNNFCDELVHHGKAVFDKYTSIVRSQAHFNISAFKLKTWQQSYLDVVGAPYKFVTVRDGESTTNDKEHGGPVFEEQSPLPRLLTGVKTVNLLNVSSATSASVDANPLDGGVVVPMETEKVPLTIVDTNIGCEEESGTESGIIPRPRSKGYTFKEVTGRRILAWSGTVTDSSSGTLLTMCPRAVLMSIPNIVRVMKGFTRWRAGWKVMLEGTLPFGAYGKLALVSRYGQPNVDEAHFTPQLETQFPCALWNGETSDIACIEQPFYYTHEARSLKADFGASSPGNVGPEDYWVKLNVLNHFRTSEYGMSVSVPVRVYIVPTEFELYEPAPYDYTPIPAPTYARSVERMPRLEEQSSGDARVPADAHGSAGVNAVRVAPRRRLVVEPPDDFMEATPQHNTSTPAARALVEDFMLDAQQHLDASSREQQNGSSSSRVVTIDTTGVLVNEDYLLNAMRTAQSEEEHLRLRMSYEQAFPKLDRYPPRLPKRIVQRAEADNWKGVLQEVVEHDFVPTPGQETQPKRPPALRAGGYYVWHQKRTGGRWVWFDSVTEPGIKQNLTSAAKAVGDAALAAGVCIGGAILGMVAIGYGYNAVRGFNKKDESDHEDAVEEIVYEEQSDTRRFKSSSSSSEEHPSSLRERPPPPVSLWRRTVAAVERGWTDTKATAADLASDITGRVAEECPDDDHFYATENQKAQPRMPPSLKAGGWWVWKQADRDRPGKWVWYSKLAANGWVSAARTTGRFVASTAGLAVGAAAIGATIGVLDNALERGKEDELELEEQSAVKLMLSAPRATLVDALTIPDDPHQKDYGHVASGGGVKREDVLNIERNGAKPDIYARSIAVPTTALADVYSIPLCPTWPVHESNSRNDLWYSRAGQVTRGFTFYTCDAVEVTYDFCASKVMKAGFKVHWTDGDAGVDTDWEEYCPGVNFTVSGTTVQTVRVENPYKQKWIRTFTSSSQDGGFPDETQCMGVLHLRTTTATTGGTLATQAAMRVNVIMRFIGLKVADPEYYSRMYIPGTLDGQTGLDRLATSAPAQTIMAGGGEFRCNAELGVEPIQSLAELLTKPMYQGMLNFQINTGGTANMVRAATFAYFAPNMDGLLRNPDSNAIVSLAGVPRAGMFTDVACAPNNSSFIASVGDNARYTNVMTQALSMYPHFKGGIRIIVHTVPFITNSTMVWVSQESDQPFGPERVWGTVWTNNRWQTLLSYESDQRTMSNFFTTHNADMLYGSSATETTISATVPWDMGTEHGTVSAAGGYTANSCYRHGLAINYAFGAGNPGSSTLAGQLMWHACAGEDFEVGGFPNIGKAWRWMPATYNPYVSVNFLTQAATAIKAKPKLHRPLEARAAPLSYRRDEHLAIIDLEDADNDE